jgi:hypothetical protein
LPSIIIYILNLTSSHYKLIIINKNERFKHFQFNIIANWLSNAAIDVLGIKKKKKEREKISKSIKIINKNNTKMKWLYCKLKNKYNNNNHKNNKKKYT